jgi:hypothetical protein
MQNCFTTSFQFHCNLMCETHFFISKSFQQTEQNHKLEWHKLLVGLQQTSGLEKEVKSVMMTIVC